MAVYFEWFKRPALKCISKGCRFESYLRSQIARRVAGVTSGGLLSLPQANAASPDKRRRNGSDESDAKNLNRKNHQENLPD
jgi:hypothetical protein